MRSVGCYLVLFVLASAWYAALPGARLLADEANLGLVFGRSDETQPADRRCVPRVTTSWFAASNEPWLNNFTVTSNGLVYHVTREASAGGTCEVLHAIDIPSGGQLTFTGRAGSWTAS